MSDKKIEKLDQEFKRYLQILRPYVGQLASEEAIKICNEWIIRLSNCKQEEKPLRNKYIFILCYQLAKGVLDDPFLNKPPDEDLQGISDIVDSDSSMDMEYIVVNEENQNIYYNDDEASSSDEEFNATRSNCEKQESTKGGRSLRDINSARSTRFIFAREEDSSQVTRKQRIQCYTCPALMRVSAQQQNNAANPEQYEFRAHNLILKLREIKRQNMLLHKEIEALKEESKEKQSFSNLYKVNTATSTNSRLGSNTKLNCLKAKIQEAEEDKRSLMNALDTLQGELVKRDDMKKREIEDLEARHKVEIYKLKTTLREESKVVYDERIIELKDHYEKLITDLKEKHDREIEDIIDSRNKTILELKRTIEVKNEEINEKDCEINENKFKIKEKEKIIEETKFEIAHLRSQIEEHATNFQSVLNKFLDKPVDDHSDDNMKIKAQELENKLNRMEKSRIKCLKAYETKLASLQKEKHLSECSWQIQLVKQRAQVVNEMTEQKEAALAEVVNKLEAKYKDIIANVQATAIQRRMQDEEALNAVVQAACAYGIPANHSQSGKTTTIRGNKECTQSCDSDISVHQTRMRANHSLGEESAGAGYCLHGERLTELLDRLHVPQRDDGDASRAHH